MAKVEMIPIHPTSPSLGGTILLPASSMKTLGLSNGIYEVAFGAKKMKLNVQGIEKHREPQDAGQVSPNVIEGLCLPQGAKLSLLKKGDTLRLGYVFGIMSNPKVVKGQVIGQQEAAFRHLLRAANKLGMFGYVFSPLDIRWDSQTVTAYAVNQQGKWQTLTMPLPDVVYDQIVSRTFQSSKDVAASIERLHAFLKQRYFNAGYFNKWQVHEWLAGDELTKKYVPETILFEKVETAAPFMYQFPDVYIKPAHGSLGISIIRARRRPDGQVVYQEKVKEGSLRHGTSGSVSVFFKRFESRFLKGSYVIQETLHLMTYQDRPFDIRLVLQKDGSGQWKRTKTFCRVAQAGEITSNLSTGGDAITVRQLLQDVLHDPKRVDRVMKEIRKIAADVPIVIEREVGSRVGELGLDLGLDTKGRVWVIEINSKPWKKPNIEESEFPELALQAFERPVQYSRYLCETDPEL